MGPSYLPGTGRGTSRRLVEGRAARGDDVTHDGVAIDQDLTRRNAESAEATGGEVVVARGVASGTITARMRLSVDFDRETCRQAGEVQAIRPDRMLASELEAAGSGAERAPEDHLGHVAGAALLARPLDSGALRGEDPSTSLRPVPLPVPGRYGRQHRHIRNTPNRGVSSTGAVSAAARASPSTSRVCAGSTTPSSHRRAVA